MIRQFKTIADAVPIGMFDGEIDKKTYWFTAAETAQLMREYGKVVRYATKAHWLIKLYFEGDPKRKRRYYRFFCRCVKVRGEIESKMAEWEKDSRRPHA
jgi:hypothetical protein